MKKELFYLIIALCLTITSQKLVAQEIATIPYFWSSEQRVPQEEQLAWAFKKNWNYKNTFRWIVNADNSGVVRDSLVMEASSNIMWSYDYESTGVCLAERKINLNDYDSLKIEFLSIMGGEDTNDFLKIFLVPLDTNWETIYDSENVPYMIENTEYDLWFYNDTYSGLENKISQTQGNEITYNTEWIYNIGKNQVYKLVLAWRTDNNNNTNDRGYLRIGKMSITGKYATQVGINDVLQENIISVYPNPVKDIITLDLRYLTLNNIETITIINNAGQIIKVIKDVKKINEIDVSDIESGVYYIKVGEIIKKIIIE